jgi:hypothetical protein
MTLKLILTAALLAMPVAVQAQDAPKPMEAKPTCAAISDAGLPATLSGWTTRTDLPAAGKASELNKAGLPIGKGVNGQLKHTPEVKFTVLPEKPGGSVSYGGMYQLVIKEAGTYQLSLGAGAWIDVFDGGTALMSSAHAPGPACTTLRKTVQFPLKAQKYTVQLSGNGDPVLPIMVTRVPG